MPIGIKPVGDKLMRMEAQCARFEARQVYLPRDASWLSDCLHEILSFPNTRMTIKSIVFHSFSNRLKEEVTPHL
jgi:phage terminase large subunit-like protein